MNSVDMIAVMNEHRPPAVTKLGGRVTAYDPDSGVLEMRFDLDESFCHSGDIVQGGYIAGMLDASMAHAVFAHIKTFAVIATLEIKVSYLEIARPGRLTARGEIVRLGKSIGFMQASLYDNDGRQLAAATSTARIIRKDPRP